MGVDVGSVRLPHFGGLPVGMGYARAKQHWPAVSGKAEGDELPILADLEHPDSEAQAGVSTDSAQIDNSAQKKGKGPTQAQILIDIAKSDGIELFSARLTAPDTPTRSWATQRDLAAQGSGISTSIAPPIL